MHRGLKGVKGNGVVIDGHVWSAQRGLVAPSVSTRGLRGEGGADNGVWSSLDTSAEWEVIRPPAGQESR